MRKLATIQEIVNIEKIEKADMIEKATILGWEVVVAKKDNFKIGDKIIYIEVDSVLPDNGKYEFLRERKFRIRTIKLKGQVSQGMVLPISELNNIKCSKEIGTDVTELLGIKKYLTPSERDDIENNERLAKIESNRLKKYMMRYSLFRRFFLNRKTKEGFPYWISKTDEERVQNIPEILERFKDATVYVTEKIDYQSVTFTSKVLPKFGGVLGKIFPFKKNVFMVCSRNLLTNDKNSLYWKIAKKYNIEEILKQNPDLSIQGEQGSSGVQGNKYGISEPTMWVFNIINHKTKEHFDYNQMSDFCYKYGLNIVPLICFRKLSDIGTTVKEIVEFSKGKSVINNQVNREGVVIRCIENGKKLLSFKAINPDFLLKYED